MCHLSFISDEELAALREELEHHQQKMDMFRYLRNELDAFSAGIAPFIITCITNIMILLMLWAGF